MPRDTLDQRVMFPHIGHTFPFTIMNLSLVTTRKSYSHKRTGVYNGFRVSCYTKWRLSNDDAAQPKLPGPWPYAFRPIQVAYTQRTPIMNMASSSSRELSKTMGVCRQDWYVLSGPVCYTYRSYFCLLLFPVTSINVNFTADRCHTPLLEHMLSVTLLSTLFRIWLATLRSFENWVWMRALLPLVDNQLRSIRAHPVWAVRLILHGRWLSYITLPLWLWPMLTELCWSLTTFIPLPLWELVFCLAHCWFPINCF